MAPIVLTLIQAVVLLLLYLFVARAVRAIVRDLRAATDPSAAAPSPARAAPQSAQAPQPAQAGGRGRPQPSELVVHSPEGRARVVALDGAADIILGRGRNSTVALHDSYASERHARIYRDRGEWLVTDLGSTNGTFLNRARVTRPTRIAVGDQLGIGQTTVEVRS